MRDNCEPIRLNVMRMNTERGVYSGNRGELKLCQNRFSVFLNVSGKSPFPLLLSARSAPSHCSALILTHGDIQEWHMDSFSVFLCCL